MFGLRRSTWYLIIASALISPYVYMYIQALWGYKEAYVVAFLNPFLGTGLALWVANLLGALLASIPVGLVVGYLASERAGLVALIASLATVACVLVVTNFGLFDSSLASLSSVALNVLVLSYANLLLFGVAACFLAVAIRRRRHAGA